jgi:hypothetical protein
MVSLAKHHLQKDKKLVIIGGNSLAMGIGQGKDLWSEKLQNKLGSNYSVLNMGQSGMPAFCGPFIAFLSLAQANENVIYVGFAEPLWFAFLETPFNGYPYWWDAYYKGLIPDYPYLTGMLNYRLDNTSEAEKLQQRDAMLQAYLDSIFYFEDLWTTIGYKSFFTVWTPYAGNTFFKPRKDYPDVDLPPIPLEHRFERVDADSERQRMIFRQRDMFENGKPIPYKIKGFKLSALATVPESLRARVLLVEVRNNPVIMNRLLSNDEIALADNASELNQKIWAETGCRSVFIGKGYIAEDYLDDRHLSGLGAEKLASTIAEQIKEIK